MTYHIWIMGRSEKNLQISKLVNLLQGWWRENQHLTCSIRALHWKPFGTIWETHGFGVNSIKQEITVPWVTISFFFPYDWAVCQNRYAWFFLINNKVGLDILESKLAVCQNRYVMNLLALKCNKIKYVFPYRYK